MVRLISFPGIPRSHPGDCRGCLWFDPYLANKPRLAAHARINDAIVFVLPVPVPTAPTTIGISPARNHSHLMLLYVVQVFQVFANH
jgi:hypothetical protein